MIRRCKEVKMSDSASKYELFKMRRAEYVIYSWYTLWWVFGSRWMPCLLKIGSVMFVGWVNFDKPHSLDIKASLASTNRSTSWVSDLILFVNSIKSSNILYLIFSDSWFLSSITSHCCRWEVDTPILLVCLQLR